MIIAIDFDGTVVTNEYPEIGKDVGSVKVLQTLVENGNKLILYTMRSGKELEQAIQWFEAYNIPLLGVNENPFQKSWTNSPKVYANLYIDDCALGIPLRRSLYVEKPYVDWTKVVFHLVEVGAIMREELMLCLDYIIKVQNDLE